MPFRHVLAVIPPENPPAGESYLMFTCGDAAHNTAAERVDRTCGITRATAAPQNRVETGSAVQWKRLRICLTHIIEINDVDELADYRLLWNALLARTPRASFFHTIDWLSAYWRHYGREQKLRVFVAYAAEQPIGILPLVVRSESTRLGKVRVLTYPLHDWGSFYSPIGSNPTATLLLGLGHVARGKRDWDLVDLRWINDTACDRKRTSMAMRVKDLPARRVEDKASAMIELAGSWDSYFAAKKSHWRTNYRRAERRVAEAGAVEHVRYRPLGASYDDADPRWDLYEICENLAAESWQGHSTTGTTLSHADIRAFLRDAHEAAARAGALDMNLLYIAGQPVAFNYAYHYQGYVFGLRMGFSSERAPDGAGTVLLGRMIKDSYDRRDTMFDLGAGYLECKRHFQTHTEQAVRYTHFPADDLRAQALRLKRGLETWWHSRRGA